MNEYSYFGARYYNSDISVWLSVDPLADKYPSMSSYMYTAGNPVMLIDPDGRKIRPIGKDADEIVKTKSRKYGQILGIVWDSEKNIYGIHHKIVYNNYSDLKRAMKKSDKKYSKKEINEAWSFYKGLKDNDILEFTITHTKKNTKDYSYKPDKESKGSTYSGSGLYTINSEYQEFADIIKVIGEMTKQMADALYRGKEITIEDKTYEIKPTNKGFKWVYFNNNNSEQNNVKGHLLIDATGLNEEQINNLFNNIIDKF